MEKYYEVGEKVVLVGKYIENYKPWEHRDHYIIERRAKVGTYGVYWITSTGIDLTQLGGHAVCNQADYARYLQDRENQKLLAILSA